jgi:putative ABC transport system substrate-binding protein
VNRRHFILAVATWPALAWASAVLAQSKQPVLIGWLNTGSRESIGHLFAAFKEGLAALGWKEGSNYVMEERWADGRTDRLPALAGELAAKRPAVIVAGPIRAVEAAARAASRTPVVMVGGGDPVTAGLVASLARPGGMVTGVSSLSAALSEKFLELLLAAAPKVRRIGFLVDTAAALRDVHLANARRSVKQHSVEARYAEVARPEEIEPALARLAKDGMQALVVMPSTVFGVEQRRIMNFALAQRWPVIGAGGWAEAGALLSYSADGLANHRRAAYYVDRILKGTKPGDLPIEQPTKFELVLNLKTARALKLEISRELAVRADRVIE